MAINATLFIQMINFCIAYIIIRIFLLKPAIRIIQQENNTKQQLFAVINQQQQSIAIKENEQKQIWKKCRTYFMENKPPKDTITTPSIFKKVGIVPPPISDTILNEKIKETHQLLIKKIGSFDE